MDVTRGDIVSRLEIAIGSKCKNTGVDEITFCCHYCLRRIGKPDTKYHLYINPHVFQHGIQGWYFCHRCGATGPISRILRSQIDRTFNVSDFDTMMKKFKAGVPTKITKDVELPYDYLPIVKGTKAYDYLVKRKITSKLVSYYRIGAGSANLLDMDNETRRKYAGTGRIVFPDFDSEGKILYWVARTYVNHKVKYKNPALSNAGNQIYNLVRASQYKEVIITEGVISAISAGKNAVCTYGKDVTKAQVAKLVSAGFDTYYVALDGDALEKTPGSKQVPPAFRLSDALLRRSCNVKLVSLPYGEDPDSVKDFKSYLDNAETWDSESSMRIRLKSNLIK